MTTPVTDPTGKRAKLKASSLALAAIAAMIVAVTVKSPNVPPPPPPPPVDTTRVDSTPKDTTTPVDTTHAPPPVGTVDTLAAVHQWQCPITAPEAIVVDIRDLSTIRVAGDTVSYRPVVLRPASSTSAPLVLCGPATMIRQVLTHPEAGHGAVAILSPPDSATTSYVVPSLTVVNGHVIAPSNAAALSRAGLTTLVATAINAWKPGTVDTAQRYAHFAISSAADSTHAYVLQSVLRYVPAVGTRARTQETEVAGSCWGGDPWGQCAANGGAIAARTATSWLAAYNPAIPADRVLRLVAVTMDASHFPDPTFNAFDASWTVPP